MGNFIVREISETRAETWCADDMPDLDKWRARTAPTRLAALTETLFQRDSIFSEEIRKRRWR